MGKEKAISKEKQKEKIGIISEQKMNNAHSLTFFHFDLG